MSIITDITDEYPDYVFTTIDGFDDAIEGIMECANMNPKVIYNKEKIINMLIDMDMTYDEAMDYFYFNIFHVYINDQAPVFIHKKGGTDE